MSEWLDIVDAQDRVIGRDTRARVHAGGHFHRSSHVILLNSHQQVFVQLRSTTKDTNPGLWDTSAAGHVDSGESYLSCAVRELQEELGIDVPEQAMVLIGKLQPKPSNGHEFTHIFTVSSDSSVVLEAGEVADGRWVSPSELEGWMAEDEAQFTDVFRMIWGIYRSSHL